MMRKSRLSIGLITGILFIGGCASKPPEAISKVPADNPSLARVRLDIDQYLGAAVRWGGEISKVENKADQTWIEIVRRELLSNGKPESSDMSDGRFIASFDGFADPVEYEIGHLLTVVGTIENKVKRPIGEFDYLFPLVTVEGSYLWETNTEARYPGYPPPWWYYDYRYGYPGPYYRSPWYR